MHSFYRLYILAEYFTPHRNNHGSNINDRTVITAIVATGPAIQTLPTEPTRTQAADTEFLLAIDTNHAKILISSTIPI